MAGWYSCRRSLRYADLLLETLCAAGCKDPKSYKQKQEKVGMARSLSLHRHQGMPTQVLTSHHSFEGN